MDLRTRLAEFLEEDVGYGDITTESVLEDRKVTAHLIAKEYGIIAGVAVVEELYAMLGCQVESIKIDGSHVERGNKVMIITGMASDVLKGERLALNIMMRMSGIATKTSRMLSSVREVDPRIMLAATRKTTPGFRYFEKTAVVIGGGVPHRWRLDDAILIKDNHLAVAGSITKAVEKARSAGFTKVVEVEVKDRQEAIEAYEAGADVIMLDNFEPSVAETVYTELKEKGSDVVVEVSGGIREETIEDYANCGDVISVGGLTHSARALDLSIEIDWDGSTLD